ncbi:hypothetical protein NHX12_003898 [Muraenolepis orangiensis]|uniref:GATA-type transcription activator N-terminal domain-containing protein n=1 Tax=Muraenolepis orangiensis TaxID=630683 RepID=A0A9Q0DU89_9TELE|nr:hypothetical protein NHX12_003898 [Muraenolepis orangiensis]
MELGESSWSMVKREVSSSPGELDAALLGHRRPEGRSLHSYVHFGHHHHHHHHANGLGASEDIPLFTDLDQGNNNKLVLSSGAHKAGLLVDPADMYQTLAIAAAQSQPGYDTSANGYMHSNPNSPVYVPSSRVGPMIPSLSYLPAGGSGQPNHGVGGHSVWSQSPTESPSYTTSSPHAPNRFHYSPSPPMNNGVSRDSGYANTLSSREQYGLSRPLSGSYPSPYSP